MPLTQVDHMEAALRRLERARDAAREKLKELDEDIAALKRIIANLPRLEQGGDLLTDVRRPVRKRGYLRSALEEWIAEREKPEFTAMDTVPFLELRGFDSKHLYNNIYECLCTLAERGRQIEKIPGGFKKK